MEHNRIHQRVLALLLSFSLVFSMVQMAGISAFADENSGVTAYCNGTELFKDSAFTEAVDRSRESEYLNSITRIVVKDSTETIGEYACDGCTHLTAVVIPDSVTSIGEYAFSDCGSLAEITIPESVTSIGDEAFESDSSLRTVTFQAGSQLHSIGDTAFLNCSQLTGIVIPAGVTSIENSAFSNCESLTGITIPGSVMSIGASVFSGCANLQTVTFGADSQLNSIGQNAFSDCSHLTGIAIPDRVTSIGDDAFFGCSAMQSIMVGSNNTRYSSDGVSLLSHDGTELIVSSKGKAGNYQVPASVTSIDKNAFIDCTHLTVLTLPDSISTIGDNAFGGCKSLKSINLPKSLTGIGPNLFDYCYSLVSMTIPKRVTSIDLSAFSHCDSLNAINVEPGNSNYCSSDGVLYTVESNGKLALTLCPKAKTGVCTVKTGTTIIGDSAFLDCSNLTDINLPEGLTTIEEYAFDDCAGLTRIDLPESVTSAHANLFEDCTGLKAVAVSANTSFQYDIWNDSFDFDTISNLYVVKGEGDTDNSPACKNKFYFAKSSDGSSYQFRSYAGTKVGIVIPTDLYGKPISPAIQASDLAATPLIAYYNGGESLYSDSGYQNEINKDQHCKVTSVVISNDTTNIRYNVFNDCSSLMEINIPASVTDMNDDPFPGCSALQSITVAPGNPQFCSRDSVLYKKEDSGKFSLLCCPGARTGKFEIPADVDTVKNNAFENCIGMTSVTIPSGVTEIGEYAFKNCTGLADVTIPSGVTEIGNEAFGGCTGLNIVLLEGAATEIGECTFCLERHNPSLTVYVPQANLDFYNFQIDDLALEGTSAEIKAIPVISAFDTSSQQITVSTGTALAGLNLPQTLSATVNGTPHAEVNGVTWNADRSYDPNTKGFYNFTAALPFYYRTAGSLSLPKISVHVVSSSESHSSGTAVPFHPSGVTDTATNAQVDLSGATLPAGVTNVTLSVTPEAANGVTAAPGTAGGTADPQGAAAFRLVVSDAALNIIGTPVLYNLKLLDQSGNPVPSFTGSVTVRLAVPAGIHGMPHVFRYEESTGTFTDLDAAVQNGFLVFSTTHFSYYFVAGVGDSVALDTRNYQMPVNGKYQIGLKLTGSKAASVKVTSTNEKIAAAARLKNGNVSVTGKGPGTSYIMIDVYDSKNHLLTHASVKIDVKTGIRPRGDSTRQIGVF